MDWTKRDPLLPPDSRFVLGPIFNDDRLPKLLSSQADRRAQMEAENLSVMMPEPLGSDTRIPLKGLGRLAPLPGKRSGNASNSSRRPRVQLPPSFQEVYRTIRAEKGLPAIVPVEEYVAWSENTV